MIDQDQEIARKVSGDDLDRSTRFLIDGSACGVRRICYWGQEDRSRNTRLA
jgi:hypothetical protein